MSARFRVTPSAIADLNEHIERLRSVSGLKTSRRFAKAARSTFARYAGMPGLGERHELANPRLAGLRVGLVQGFEAYLVFYRAIDGGIEIVRIIHGARDIGRALDEGE